MKCPKCPGQVNESKTSRGATYGWCVFCKGMWISLSDLRLTMTDTVLGFLGAGLGSKAKTSFTCSYCDGPLVTGKAAGSSLQLEECEACKRFYFDAKEVDALLDLMSHKAIPVAGGLKFDVKKLKETGDKCPICTDVPLFSYDGNADRFKTCLKCDGILSSVPVLENIAHHSLFGPTMFTFRKERGLIAQCRFCHAEQELANTSCIKCGREMVRAKCLTCKSDMSEYVLNEVNIERCQICNEVWMDQGEFEQVMSSMPDMRKRYEEGARRNELHEAIAEADTFTVGYGIELSTRKIADHCAGMWSFFFY
jgi:Zn-finger nucleic acid-binding protein